MDFVEDKPSLILAKDSAEARGDEGFDIWKNLSCEKDGASGAVAWDPVSDCDAGIGDAGTLLVSGIGH